MNRSRVARKSGGLRAVGAPSRLPSVRAALFLQAVVSSERSRRWVARTLALLPFRVCLRKPWPTAFHDSGAISRLTGDPSHSGGHRSVQQGLHAVGLRLLVDGRAVGYCGRVRGRGIDPVRRRVSDGRDRCVIALTPARNYARPGAARLPPRLRSLLMGSSQRSEASIV
jgi:hypothetical protein